ncbi:prosaposin isoform 2-T2 [Gastrophryne carolinensis]
MKAIVALIAVLGAATPLFGTEQCMNGPPVWCVNLQTAKQCNAVTHCQQTVWNKPVVNSVPCDLCKEVVAVVANYLKDNATQGQILSTLEKVCDFIPDPSISTQCKQIIEQYYPLVISIIEGEMGNPGVVCCALGLCKSLQQHLASLRHTQQLLTNEIPDADMEKMLSPLLTNVPLLLYPQEKVQEAAKTKDVCQDCLQLISDVQDTLKTNSSFSKTLVENFLKQCDQYGGGFAEVCKEYINQYADLAIQMIIQMSAKQICSGLGLCAEKSAPPQEVIPAKVIVPAMKLQPAIKVEPASKVAEKGSDDFLPVCELCQIVVKQVEELLENNRTETRIKEALEKVCHILPSKYREKCVDFVDTYCAVIIELLKQEATPKVVCLALGCCNTRAPQPVNLRSEKAQSQVCDVCKMMMSYVESFLEKNTTQQRIEQALERVCSFLPPSMLDECSQIIKEYEPMIISLLLQEVKPDLVCTELGFCQNAPKRLLGVEKCMWGPSYWCKDLETAATCNAIEHCKRHVWS